MARRKTPDNETKAQKNDRLLCEKVANAPDRSEKVSWKRKMKNLQELVDETQPISEEILKLIAQRQPFLDKIQDLRETMVNECIHPFDFLVVEENHVLCKFCNRKIRVNDGAE